MLSSLSICIPPSSNKKPTASVAKGYRFPYPWQIFINAAVSETFSKDHTLQTTLFSLSASTSSFSNNTLLPITALAQEHCLPEHWQAGIKVAVSEGLNKSQAH